MAVAFYHPDRAAPQFAYSDGDIAYLERTGWKRQIPALLKPPASEAPVEIDKPKRGRPRKPVLETQ